MLNLLRNLNIYKQNEVETCLKTRDSFSHGEEDLSREP